MLNKEKMLNVFEENKNEIMEEVKKRFYNSYFEARFSGWDSHYI